MTRHDLLSPIWPRPQEATFLGGSCPLAQPLLLQTKGEAPWLAAQAGRVAEILNAAAGRTVVVADTSAGSATLALTTMEALPPGPGLAPVEQPEGYVLSVSGQGVVLAGRDAAGLFYGAQSLACLLRPEDRSSLAGAAVRDWPRFPFRAAHVYMPARENLDFFRRFLDFLARLKCNTLILEFGGGMQYDRRPEINEAWRRFVREAWAYDPAADPHTESMSSQRHAGHPRGPVALQVSRYFPKNSIHPELAGGDCLTKDEVKGILAECAARHIEVIPEVQALSHSYYLCCAHPEIAEHAEDPWPDTYCPSNPASYELLFDVMDEVIEVVRPRVMHVGHDEWYLMGVCPKCRTRTGHDILVGDVTRIHDFLAGRGVKTMMWGDKFLNLPSGGVERRRKDPATGREWHQLATYEAARRVPSDLIIMDWYWSLAPDTESIFHDYGFTTVYGNFSPLGFENWKERAHAPWVLGAEMSSWCAVEPYAFGHNGVFYDFFPGADMLWNGEKLPNDEVCALMARWIPPEIEKLAGRRSWLVSGGGGRVVPVDISGVARELPRTLASRLNAGARLSTVLGTGSFELLTGTDGFLEKALVLDRAHPQADVPVGGRGDRLLVLHAANMPDVHLELTFNAFHRGPAVLLEYRVEYEDGSKERFSSVYGDDIGDLAGHWPFPRTHWMYNYCHRAVPVEVAAGPPEEAGASEGASSHTTARGTTMTIQRDVSAPGCKFFAQEWENPRPGVPIRSITIALGPDASDKGEVLIPALSLVTGAGAEHRG